MRITLEDLETMSIFKDIFGAAKGLVTGGLRALLRDALDKVPIDVDMDSRSARVAGGKE